MSEYARLVIAADSTQVRQVERDLAQLERRSVSTESAVVSMGKKIGAAFAGIKLADHISDVVQLASRYDQMGLVMETVGRNTGRSTVELAALDQALQETGISALQSRNNIIRMMSANIDLAQATNLARLAQDAAVIANTNSSEAFERLIRGIQSAEKETLETMGLNVNFAQSYEKLAAQLGKKADQLTVVERVQAGVNAALEAGTNIAGAYDASMENAGKRLGSTTRHLENLQIALGATAQSEFGFAVDSYSGVLKLLGENAETVAQVIETSLYVAVARGAAGMVNKTTATVSATLASRAQAAEELRLAQAHAATTATALAHARANHTLMGSTTQLTAATLAHEAAQKRVAAAQLAATGASRAVLGVLGGPVGIIAMVGLAALSFVDFGNKAQSGMNTAASASEQGATRIRNAMRSLIPDDLESLTLDQLNDQIAELEGKLSSARDRYEGMQRAIDEGRAPRGSTFFVSMTEEVKALEAALGRLKELRDGEKFETDIAGQRWLANLQQRADFAGDLTEVQRTLIAIEKGYAGTLSETDKALALANAALIDKANATKAAGKETIDFAKNLSDLLDESRVATTSANAMADAYLAGADSVRELTLEQKVEEQLLRTGASARGAVTKALRDQQQAMDRLDIAKNIADIRQQNKDLQAELNIRQTSNRSLALGREAQKAYNVEKQLAAALAGKSADALSDETEELRRQLEIQEDLREEMEAHDRIAGLIDSTATAQERLNRRLEELSELRTWAETPEQIRAIDRAMQEAQREASQWAQWTESALERVDSAFADAWRNIGDGFGSFRDNLVNAFKQMLAELAHLAITRPIVLQIGAAMGIGGAAAQLSSMGGGGGFDLIGMLGRGVSLSQSGFGQAVISGWQSGEGVLGGLQGAFSSGSSYVSGLFGGGAATGAGTGYGLGQPLVAGELGAASYAAPAMQTWGGAATSLGAILGGLGGAYMGWQQNGLKGAVGTGLASWGGGTLGGMGGAALGQAIGGTIGSVLPGIGTAIGVALGGLLGGSLFGGSGEKYKRTVGSATGSYADGQYTSGGQSQTWFAGYHRTFGDEFNQTLDDLNRSFSATLGGLFDAFDIDSTIETETRARQRRTSGRLAADFLVTIDGEMAEHLRQYGGKGDVAKAMEEFADDIMGEYLAKTIVNSALPEYLRDQFRGLTEADQVAETLAGVIARFDGVNSALDLVGITLLETTDAGLRAADAIAAMGGGIEAFNASVGVYYDQFYSAAEKQAHVIDAVTAAFESADIPLADSREAYRAMVESIDVTTEAGQEMFATMMGLAGQAAQYYSIIEQEAAQAAAMAEQEAAQRLANAANYYDLFATDAEKAQDQLSGIFNAFRDSGLYLARTREGFRDVIGALDTSTEAGRQAHDSYMAMAGLANTYYDIMETRQANALAAEQELAAAELRRYDEIKRAADSVSSSLSGFRETLILDQLGSPDAQYEYFKAQADGMARLASTLTDPQAIAQAARDASSYASRAYGLLDDEQKELMGGQMLDFVNRLEAMSHQRIEQSEQRSAEITAEATAAAVGKEVGRIADAIISHLNRSGEGTKELISAIRAVASSTGSQYAPQYEEVNA